MIIKNFFNSKSKISLTAIDETLYPQAQIFRSSRSCYSDDEVSKKHLACRFESVR